MTFEDKSGPVVTVPSVSEMDDETLIKHFERRHGEDVSVKFTEEPDREGLPRRLRGGNVWRTYHDKMHELYDGRENSPYHHTHRTTE